METETPKLIVFPERIIHILLKHLMVLKNENAYLKKSAALNMFENSSPENNIGINNVQNTISENNIGTNNVQNGIIKNNIGTNNVLDGIVENNIGANSVQDGTVENNIGANSVQDGIVENRIGINNVQSGIFRNNIGVKSIYESLSNREVGANQDSLLYSVFERELVNALNEYIKSGDGQNTVYDFYADFLEAVVEKNSFSEKIKQATANLALEDTHILPSQITMERVSIVKLGTELRQFLPRNSRRDLFDRVATELLFLRNAVKTTGTELRKSVGLSKAGFSKHLPNLKKYGLIKKQPPSNYVLTEKATHLLLKTFGIPKG